MEDTNSVAKLIDSTNCKIQQLQKAFAELESHRAVTLNLKWKELEEHFHGLERSLKRRFHELEGQEKELETKASKARELLEKREADVLAKEQASLEKLQVNRDAAAIAISNALKKHRRASSVELAVGTGEDDAGGAISEENSSSVVTTESYSEDTEDNSEVCSAEVTSYPLLDRLCKDMDSEGLHRFISDNRKNLAMIREEIPFALKAAPSPAGLVLRSLEDFYSMDLPNVDGKKDSNLLGLRRTCIMLMECLMVMLGNDGISASDIIPEDVKQQAKVIAEEWKPKLDALDMNASNGNSLEAHAFLQLLATFGIASDFEGEYLSRLIPMVSRRRQTAELCRSLGLTSKMPGVIELLANSGRQIDAVNLAFAFELTNQFSPVPLLKSYLKDVKKFSSPVKPGNSSPSGQIEVNEKELSALKAVIKCIEEHKLEEQFPVDPLQKLVLQMEKAKADKKSAAEVAKPQPKRPRAGGVANGHHVVTFAAANKTFYPNVADGYPQYVYDRPYVYPAPTDNRGQPILAAAAYNLPPSHGNFYGNAYHYHAPFLH
ncbi:FRIGIDA-like protein 3 [Eucalyptus grandis]|uniref:FRIGIDA-like protein n=4 Tax=Eucalyptus grandis TaxID=71139 RepID=A0A059A3L3_EUCGR|nr:FRIGIDA-like protein 3 [Eucalyptus grandis]XP_010037086.1 FRIGIDA-like protein 3 [Eucalyptus grandis]KAK3406187.1 hypothetical protein EUGRSUZ_K02358 [Eucalyptus grandis]KAK3406190.1 hypothetical protein EUGRSUZ_K02358 [Eucalyptus grandis]KAK3406191.1 hypothetical protein EUGRSUZ_K02358 [Eucalyptus grandis]